jgi:WXG100 family type VII secretion target
MGDLQVSESVVAGVAKSLRGVADDTKSDLAGLDGELSRLLGAGWTGQAGSAFDKVWAHWHEGANNVVKGLEAMASALEEAAHSYGETDASGEAAISSAGM